MRSLYNEERTFGYRLQKWAGALFFYTLILAVPTATVFELKRISEGVKTPLKQKNIEVGPLHKKILQTTEATKK